jgi:hypothetical protein
MILRELLNFIFILKLLWFLRMEGHVRVFKTLEGNDVHLVTKLVVLGSTLLEGGPDQVETGQEEF